MIALCMSGPRELCPPAGHQPVCAATCGVLLCEDYCGPGDPPRLGYVLEGECFGSVAWTWPDCQPFDMDGDDDVDLRDIAELLVR